MTSFDTEWSSREALTSPFDTSFEHRFEEEQYEFRRPPEFEPWAHAEDTSDEESPYDDDVTANPFESQAYGDHEDPLAEMEELLGGLWDSAKGMWERTLVGMAIARGERSESTLANLVFFRRHPERSGRSIHRDEPNFKALAAEWSNIRDTIVRPMLSRTVTTSGVATSSGDRIVDYSTVRTRLVNIALAEVRFWGNGSLREGQERGWKRVEEYWSGSLGSYRPEGRTGASLAKNHAWSAVFISWAMAQAGVPRLHFRPRGSHALYMGDLIAAKRKNPAHPITVVPPYAVPLRPGDLVNNWRTWVSKGRRHGGPFTIADLESRPGHRASHTDIVTAVVPGSHAEVAGGNKSNSLKSVKVRLDGDGRLVPMYSSTPSQWASIDRWVAVIRVGT